MKILLVNCVFKQGSTGKIIESLQNGLIARGHEVYVAYGRGSMSQSPYVFRLCATPIAKIQSFFSKVTGWNYSCSPVSTNNLKKLIKQLDPDVINLHCINANTVNIAEIINFLKKTNHKTVLTAHAEFLYTGGCSHSLNCNQWEVGCRNCPQFHKQDSQLPVSWFFNCTEQQWKQYKLAYSNYDNLIITGVSDWLSERIKRSPFFKTSKVFTVCNGLDTKVFTIRDNHDLRVRLHLSLDNKVIVHVTPNFYWPIKGGHYVLKVARYFADNYPNYRFIIIGYNGDGTDLPSNTIPVPFTKNQMELAEYYSLADMALLTSERETFSMVTAESLCCGTPVVGFNAGAPETIAPKEYSRFCDFGDTETLAHNILTLGKNDIDKQLISKECAKLFSAEIMAANYERVYNSFK